MRGTLAVCTYDGKNDTDVGTVTGWIRAAGSGDEEAASHLYEFVRGELYGLAAKFFSRDASHPPPTGALDEVYMQLVAGNSELRPGRANQWKDRTHFLNVFRKALRDLRNQYFRVESTLKRGGDLYKVSLSDDRLLIHLVANDEPRDLLEDSVLQELLARLHDALELLQEYDRDASEIIVERDLLNTRWRDIANSRGKSIRWAQERRRLGVKILKRTLEAVGE